MRVLKVFIEREECRIMQYRPLGETGLSVSSLGFGAMRLPMTKVGDQDVVDRELAVPMIHRAFEAGVNYIDSAVGYCNSDSQRAVGDALKGWRDKIIVSTKNHYYDADEKVWWKNLEDSLERLQVDYLDIYNHHGMSWSAWENGVAPRLGKWMQKAKDQGMIRHICCSTHDNCENIKKIIDTGYPEVITLQYNLLDRHSEEAIAYAGEKGVGIVVMGPVGGGRLGSDSETLLNLLPEVRRIPELALRFVLANPNVTVALSGMSTMQQVEENLATVEDDRRMTPEELEAIHNHLDRMQKLAELYCTGCDYCKPCPSGINISKIFNLYNRGRIYGLWDSARGEYRHMPNNPWGKGPWADVCTECGACEPKCPQNIPIRAQLKDAHVALIEEKK
jgi:predicted aldo/keto reductase-like oxidoreductase